MGTVFQCGGGNSGTINSGVTSYNPVGSGSLSSANATESQLNLTWEDAGTLSGLSTRINSYNASATVVITNRINSGNGNQTLTATSTGEFGDSTHSDSVSAGNTLDYSVANTGGSGSFVSAVIGNLFASSGAANYVNKCYSAGATIPVTTAGTSYFNWLQSINRLITTEANAQFKVKGTFTLQNMAVIVSANTATIATVDSRIGGANGNLTVSIGSGATGTFEDTTHTDSVVSGNLVNTAINATVATSLTITLISVTMLSTALQAHYATAQSQGNLFNANTSTFPVITGKMQANAVGGETGASCQTQTTFTASNLEGYVTANGTTANSTAVLRTGLANGNQSLTWGSGATGYQEDTTHSDNILTTTEIDDNVVAGATGTNITFAYIGFLATFPAAVVNQVFLGVMGVSNKMAAGF